MDQAITAGLHLEAMRELVSRDKNRPAVIVWSIANEPDSANPLAGPYFK
jgi:beta-glucuronidase